MFGFFMTKMHHPNTNQPDCYNCNQKAWLAVFPEPAAKIKTVEKFIGKSV